MSRCNICPPAMTCICNSEIEESDNLSEHTVELERKLDDARRSAKLGWELVHRLAQQFDLPNCERVADKELAKLRGDNAGS